MSIKPHDDKLTVIVRTKESSKYMNFIEHETNLTDYVSLSKKLYPNLKIDHLENCTNFKAQQHVKIYDDKLETQKFKFGVIYQRRGQVKFDFNNNNNKEKTFVYFRQQKKNFLIMKNIIERLMNFLILLLHEFHLKILKGTTISYFSI